jgi:hypothetical protein
MSFSHKTRNDRYLFMVKRNLFSARWTGSGPRTRQHAAPGDGISEREKEQGHWGSAAADGSVPDPQSEPGTTKEQATGRKRVTRKNDRPAK